MLPSVQPVAPKLRIRPDELVFLQVLESRSEIISDTRVKDENQALVKLGTRQLAPCKRALKHSCGQVSGPVSDPELGAD